MQTAEEIELGEYQPKHAAGGPPPPELNGSGGGWWHEHYDWVILLVGAVFLFLGLYLLMGAEKDQNAG